MTLDIRPATKDDAAIIAVLKADVQAIHADAHPRLFKHPGSGTYAAADAAVLLAQPNHVAFRMQPRCRNFGGSRRVLSRICSGASATAGLLPAVRQFARAVASLS